MGSSGPELRPLARRVGVTDGEWRVDLADGRRISVPLAWLPQLSAADAAARGNWQLLGDGEGIHWAAADSRDCCRAR
jgi:hypothetical protein